MTDASNTSAPKVVRWVTAAALAALAAQRLGKGRTFTVKQLREWEPGLVARKALYATEKLRELAFVTSTAPGQYTVTADGATAIKAAAAGQVLKCGAHGPKNIPPPPTAFVSRLWALLRARRVIDTDTAASTLIDAGGDIAKAKATAMSYLRMWEKAGYLVAGKRRLPNGCKQYVLVREGGPIPPFWSEVNPRQKRKRTAKQ